MSATYLEHLDRLSDADYAAECGGRHDCCPMEMEYRGYSERPMTAVRQRAVKYDIEDLLVSTATLNWEYTNGCY